MGYRRRVMSDDIGHASSPSPTPFTNLTSYYADPNLLPDDESRSRATSPVVAILAILIIAATLYMAYYLHRQRRSIENFESLSTASREITDAFEMTSFEQAEIAANNQRHGRRKQKKRIRFNRRKRQNKNKPMPLLKEGDEGEEDLGKDLHLSSSSIQDGISTIKEEDEDEEDLEII